MPVKLRSQILFLTFSFLAISASRFIASYPVDWITIPDSAWYCSSANSLIENLRFTIGGQFNAFSLPLYSIFISPAYFLKEMESTFTLIKLLNCLAMSSTLFPVFLLAKTYLPFVWAFSVGVLSVTIGPMFYTFTVMAESLHYPLSIWIIYLTYKSIIERKRWTDLLLGFFLGLAILDKMSALVFFLCYNILMFIPTDKSSNISFFKVILRNYFNHIFVFVIFLLTISPYLIFRFTSIKNDNTLPYHSVWIRFAHNLFDFDFIKYIKWFIIYIGQLNLSTGLFILPIAIFMIVSLVKSDKLNERLFGIFSTILLLLIIALATLQSGYNLERLTERHFFVLSPVIFILAFSWFLKEKGDLNRLERCLISICIIFSTYLALFSKSTTCWPAVDSAFIDSLLVLTREGIDGRILKFAVLILSSLLIVLFGNFLAARKSAVAAIIIVFIFMVNISFPTYCEAIKGTRRLKRHRMPLLQWINKSVSSPGNLAIIGLTRSIALDHIIWNKDVSHNIFYQARDQLTNPSGFRFEDYFRLKKKLGTNNLTYIVCPFLSFCGMEPNSKMGEIELYKTENPMLLEICGFQLDFGETHTREFLKKGWSVNEGPYPDSGFPTFVWATGTEAEIEFYIERVPKKSALKFRAKPAFSPQSVGISLNGKHTVEVATKGDWQEYCLEINPSQLRPGKNTIIFRFKNTVSPAETGGNDKRNLAMAFDWLSLEDFTETH